MKVPKLRMGSYFPDDMINRYSRTDRLWLQP
jgi:transposase-like protein